MFRRQFIRHSLITVALSTYILLSFVYNEWFAFTMPRHQTVLLPLLFILGVLVAISLPKLIINDFSWGISALIFILASIIFWMIPHSVDKAVLNPTFDRIMHIHIFLCGNLLVFAFRGLIFEIKIFFLGMLSAKLIASGIVMKVFNLLLCSSFDLPQQKATGNALIVIGGTIVFFTLFAFFRKLQFTSRLAEV